MTDYATRWHDEVPGTRWFRADLHIHTIDDPPRDLPPGVTGNRTDPATLDAYARRVLDAAIEQRIEVLGLTPHAAFITAGVSAAMSIRDLWLRGVRAADGRPYRDQIYAVYPGFEPNFQDGTKGVHLLFLFDPLIEADRYYGAFQAIMQGRPAYDGHELQRTTLGIREAVGETLADDKVLGRDGYLVVAAHPLQKNGLLNRPSDDIADYSNGRVLALELRREKTLEEETSSEPKLRFAFERGRALLHTSDANDLPAPGAQPRDREIGYRFTLVKLAAPTLPALRQALLAPSSRIRHPFVRGPDESLVVRSDLPEPYPVARPWIQSVHVEGGTSFLRGQAFRFSPDLTCVIGGSMTGKSTLLDGIRYHLQGDAALARTTVAATVRSRATKQFLSGNAKIDVKSPALDVGAPVSERFPVRFFSQGELKSLSEDDDALEHLLFHLVPGRSATLVAERDELSALDQELRQTTDQMAKLADDVAEAEQALDRSAKARAAMERFTAAGVGALAPAQEAASRTQTYLKEVATRLAEARAVVEPLDTLVTPLVQDAALAATLVAHTPLLKQARDAGAAMVAHLESLEQLAASLAKGAREQLASTTATVQAALVAAGGSASDLNQFESLAKAAQHHESFKAAHDQKVAALKKLRERFVKRAQSRDELVEAHRHAMSDVCDSIGKAFHGLARIDVVPEGRLEPLQAWITGHRLKGLTQWWNGSKTAEATVSTIRKLADAVRGRNDDDVKRIAGAIGMSATVTASMVELLGDHRRRAEVVALRAPDRYRIQWVEDGEAKDLADLSGGRKVAVLLSLLLQSDDQTPLVVDQPEDELDNRVLNETIIPALHRLKGRRQVIIATHNANLVVNGDADQVIALEADAHHGRIYAEGAIEDSNVKAAILRTLDGGQEAFELRRAKYGY